MTKTKTVSVAEAEKMIADVEARWVSLGRNPDTLYLYDNHVRGAACVARTIAEKIEGLNPEKAYVAALLHDIAKIDESPESRLGRSHCVLGYERMKDIAPDVARSCLLHEFPWNIVPSFDDCREKLWDNKKDYDLVVDYVSKVRTDDLDLLISLADLMANKDGLVTIECRVNEWEKRRNETFPRVQLALYQGIKKYFDAKLGGDVYDLFPDIKRA